MGTNCIFLIKSSKAITDFCAPFSYLSSPRLSCAKPFTPLHFIMPAECLIIFALVIRRLGDGRLIYCTNLIRALIVIDRSNLSIKPKASRLSSDSILWLIDFLEKYSPDRAPLLMIEGGRKSSPSTPIQQKNVETCLSLGLIDYLVQFNQSCWCLGQSSNFIDLKESTSSPDSLHKNQRIERDNQTKDLLALDEMKIFWSLAVTVCEPNQSFVRSSSVCHSSEFCITQRERWVTFNKISGRSDFQVALASRALSSEKWICERDWFADLSVVNHTWGLACSSTWLGLLSPLARFLRLWKLVVLQQNNHWICRHPRCKLHQPFFPVVLSQVSKQWKRKWTWAQTYFWDIRFCMARGAALKGGRAQFFAPTKIISRLFLDWHAGRFVDWQAVAGSTNFILKVSSWPRIGVTWPEELSSTVTKLPTLSLRSKINQRLHSQN